MTKEAVAVGGCGKREGMGWQGGGAGLWDVLRIVRKTITQKWGWETMEEANKQSAPCETVRHYATLHFQHSKIFRLAFFLYYYFSSILKSVLLGSPETIGKLLSQFILWQQNAQRF